jgi:phosphoribosylglycinamide formyltransferase-1
MTAGETTGDAEGIGKGLRTAVLISGSGTNLQAIIDRIQSGELTIHLAAVLSDRPDAQGLTRAREAGIPTRVVDYSAFDSRPDADQQMTAELNAVAPDLVILAGFMRILPPGTVNTFRGRMLNIHPSLLPKYRGLDTYRKAIEAGDACHGATVHFVTPDLDAGPAIIQYKIQIHEHETEDALCARVQRGEYIIYPRVIGWIADGRLVLEGAEVRLDGVSVDTPIIQDEL